MKIQKEREQNVCESSSSINEENMFRYVKLFEPNKEQKQDNNHLHSNESKSSIKESENSSNSFEGMRMQVTSGRTPSISRSELGC